MRLLVEFGGHGSNVLSQLLSVAVVTHHSHCK